MDDMQLAKEIRTEIKQGDVEKVTTLIGSDRTRLEMMTVLGTWLHVAATHGKLEIVKRLVSMGADINRRGGVEGGGALNEAACEGHIDIIKYLLNCGAEMDVSDPVRNPLFGAILEGHTAAAKLLIENGIDTEVKYTGPNMKGMDALAFAHEWGRDNIAELLTSARKESPPGSLDEPKAD
jgi:ankyrin repeat protein